jgi:sugar phosphate isomerase/epimerase
VRQGRGGITAGVVSDEDEPADHPFDLAQLVEVFNRHGVSYIAIGGVSGFLHGMVDYVTQDVDMMVRSSRENRERIISALAELGADVTAVTVGDLEINTQWETQSGPLDILLTAVGPNETVITFPDLDRYAEAIEVEKGLLVRTASLDDVIRMKEAADRMKDHQALPELRRLRGDAHPGFPRGFDPFKDFPIDADEVDVD